MLRIWNWLSVKGLFFVHWMRTCSWQQKNAVYLSLNNMDTALLYQSIHTRANVDFSRSGGPGGQNVNKVNTKVTLRIKLDDLEGLNDAEKTRMRQTLTPRITNEGEVVISASEERSQHTNLVRAYARLENLISSAARLPRVRRPTRPTKAAREERLNSKRLHGLKKHERRFKSDD
jgi:ribosome-associated protein